MKLRKAQKEALLEWIAEGLQTDEINERAARFRPRFKVTRQQVDHYRKSRGVHLEEIKEQGETSALTTGLAIRENRVQALQLMADKIIADLFPENDAENKRWTNMAKTVAEEQYDYQEFNRAQFDVLRGILDDIASEMGERRPDVQVNNTFNFNMEEWKKERSKRLQAIETIEEAD
jgi:hypothetical protein